MAKAVWRGKGLAESEHTEKVEGNHDARPVGEARVPARERDAVAVPVEAPRAITRWRSTATRTPTRHGSTPIRRTVEAKHIKDHVASAGREITRSARRAVPRAPFNSPLAG